MSDECIYYEFKYNKYHCNLMNRDLDSDWVHPLLLWLQLPRVPVLPGKTINMGCLYAPDGRGTLLARYSDGDVYTAGGWGGLLGHYDADGQVYTAPGHLLARFADGALTQANGWGCLLAYVENGSVYKPGGGFGSLLAHYGGDACGAAAAAYFAFFL